MGYKSQKGIKRETLRTYSPIHETNQVETVRFIRFRSNRPKIPNLVRASDVPIDRYQSDVKSLAM